MALLAASLRPRLSLAGAVAGVMVLLVSGGVAPPVSATASVPRAVSAAPGSLVLIGGSLFENRLIVRRIIDLAGGAGVARIGVVTAASVPPENATDAGSRDAENSVADGRYYARLFERFGAVSTYRVPVDVSASGEWTGDTYGVDRASDPAVVERVGRMTGFFFGGGDQMRYAEALQDCSAGPCGDRPVLSRVRERLGEGAVVAGSSAGTTIMQGPPMVVSGESWDGWAHGVDDDDAPFRPGVVVRDEGGFGFFDDGILDSHVGARGRQGRLVRIAMYGDQDYAFGVDDSTALVVRRLGTTDEHMAVLGDGGVHVLDLSQATFTPRLIRGVRWSWLRSGDGYDPLLHTVRRRERREPVTRPRNPPDLTVGDIWSARRTSAGRMSLLGVDLARSGSPSATGVTRQRSPRFAVVLTNDRASSTWQSKGPDSRRAFAGLRLTIERR